MIDLVIKTREEQIVNGIIENQERIKVTRIYQLREKIQKDSLIFIVFGGDKVDHDKGLVGIAKVLDVPTVPVGKEGDDKYFEFEINMPVFISNPITKEELIPYRNTYNAPFIGPMTKGMQNQAIANVNKDDPNKDIHVLRAMLELRPEIELDLEKLLGSERIEEIKNMKIIKYEDIYAEEESAITNKEYKELFDPDIDKIINDFVMERRPVVAIKNHINSGKHIILNGPPGTGKTSIAENVCIEAVNGNYTDNYIITTAISDWTTFDTIGGYMPDLDTTLVFQEGVLLKSIRENSWLVIDEINRTEVDKAFGHFFTILSGKDVELQYKAKTTTGHKNIKIKNSMTLHSYYDVEEAVYYVGKNWRIIATMNTYDKNSLFLMSFAFTRRFAIVYIPALSAKNLDILLTNSKTELNTLYNSVKGIIEKSPRKLGPATIIDLITYLKVSNNEGLIDGICSLIVPQLEGISTNEIKKLYKEYSAYLSEEDNEVLRQYLSEFFDIKEEVFQKVAPIVEDTDEV